MTDLQVNTELLNSGSTDPLARSLVRSTFVVAGALAAALIGGALGAPRSELIAENVAPASQPVRIAAAAPAAVTQPSFAFGFLEFDWDPNAPGGVPGFDFWPKRDLRVAAASPRI